MLFSLFERLYDHNRCIITNQVRCEICHLTLIPVVLASSLHLSKSISGLKSVFFGCKRQSAIVVLFIIILVNFYDVKTGASREKDAERDLSSLSG